MGDAYSLSVLAVPGDEKLAGRRVVGYRGDRSPVGGVGDGNGGSGSRPSGHPEEATATAGSPGTA